MKKIRKINIGIILQMFLGAFLGGGISFIFLRTLDNVGESKPPLYSTFLVVTFIFIYYGSVIIHELTHFITFIIHGTEMRLLVMGPFIFIKEKDKWSFKFKFTAAFAIGGIAMPNMEVVDTDEKLESYRKAFARVLVAAPIANLVLNIIVLVICAISYKYVDSEVWRGYIVFIGVMTTFVSLFLNLSSLIKNDLVIGDYRAYYEILKQRDFALVCLYQYLSISDKYQAEDKMYLTESILTYLQKELDNKSFNTYTIGVLDFIIYEYLVGREKELSKVAEEYVEFIANNCEELLKAFPNKEHPLILIHHIVLYYSHKEEYKEKALELYSKITTIVNHKTPVLRYYDRRSRHVLGMELSLAYITNKNNIRTSSLYELFRLFPWYFEDETKILENLK